MNEIELCLQDGPGPVCNTYKFKTFQDQSFIPFTVVEEAAGEYVFHFETPAHDAFSTCTTVFGERRYLRMTTEQLERLPHEVVCSLLLGHSDEAIPRETAHMWLDGLPNWTPDHTDMINGLLFVLEVKTTKIRMNSHNKFFEALGQYPMGDYQGEYRYAGLGIDPSSIMFSECLKIKEDIMELCGRLFRTALRMKSRLPKETFELQPFAHVQMLERHDDPLFITKEFLEASRGQESNIEDIMLKCLRNPSVKYEDKYSKILKDSKPCTGRWTQLPLTSPSFGIEAPAQEDLSIIPRLCFSKFDPLITESSKKKINLQCTLGSVLVDEKESILRGLYNGVIGVDDSRTSVYKKGAKPTRVQSEYSIVEEVREYQREKHLRNWTPDDQGYDQFKEFWLSGDNHDKCLLFVERLIEELNAIRMSCQGKWNRWYVTKVGRYNAWVVAKGTGKENHVFYHLIVKPEIDEFGNPIITDMGAQFDKLSNGWYQTSHTLSINMSKIEQWISLRERVQAIKFYWQQRYKTWEDQFCISSLIAMDAKQATIDLSSLFRYVYMEASAMMGKGKMSKVLSKIDIPLRSRTQCLIVYRMMKVMNAGGEVVSQLDPETGVIEVATKNVLNWCTLRPIRNFQETLDLSYMHYIVRANASSGIRQLSVCMSKLIREEIKLSEARPEFMGLKSMDMDSFLSAKSHEFCAGTVRKCGKIMRSILEKNTTWKDFAEEFQQKLKEWDWEDFATFKKSTVPDPNAEKYRDFCFEEVLKNMSIAPHPLMNVDTLIREVIANPDWCRVSIFKKDQQTGIREIFVLTILMRISIKYMEILSRCMNMYLPNETLSKPYAKVERNSEMARWIRDKAKMYNTATTRAVVIRMTNSSDSKTWCQQFVMPVFALYFDEILKDVPEMAGVMDNISHILNMITSKEVVLDKNHVRWLTSVARNYGLSEEAEELIKCFGKDSESKLSGKYGDTISNRSNMMQGVPHETSSSLHAAFLILVGNIATKILKIVIKRLMEKDRRILEGDSLDMTKVSSDDGSMNLVVVLKVEIGEDMSDIEKTIKEPIKMIMGSCCVSVENAKPLMSARLSVEKSTLASPGSLEEFNSKWTIGSDIVPVSIKFMTAGFSIGYHPRLRGRVDEAISYLNSLYSNGLYTVEIQKVNELLSRFLRRSLFIDNGETATLLWDSLKCVDLGYLPIIPRQLIGVCPSDSLIKILCTNGLASDSEIKFNFYLAKTDKWNKVLLKHNASRELLNEKYKDRVVDFLMGDIDARDKILLKVLNPGSRIALSHVSDLKTFNAACYSLSCDCIRYIDEYGQKKVTTLENALLLAKRCTHTLNQVDLFWDQKLKESFKEIDRPIARGLRHRKLEVTPGLQPVYPKKTLLEYWNRIERNTPSMRLQSLVNNIRQEIAWITPSPNESRDLCNGDLVGMLSDLLGYSDKPRRVELLVPTRALGTSLNEELYYDNLYYRYSKERGLIRFFDEVAEETQDVPSKPDEPPMDVASKIASWREKGADDWDSDIYDNVTDQASVNMYCPPYLCASHPLTVKAMLSRRDMDRIGYPSYLKQLILIGLLSDKDRAIHNVQIDLTRLRNLGQVDLGEGRFFYSNKEGVYQVATKRKNQMGNNVWTVESERCTFIAPVEDDLEWVKCRPRVICLREDIKTETNYKTGCFELVLRVKESRKVLISMPIEYRLLNRHRAEALSRFKDKTVSALYEELLNNPVRDMNWWNVFVGACQEDLELLDDVRKIFSHLDPFDPPVTRLIDIGEKDKEYGLTFEQMLGEEEVDFSNEVNEEEVEKVMILLEKEINIASLQDADKGEDVDAIYGFDGFLDFDEDLTVVRSGTSSKWTVITRHASVASKSESPAAKISMKLMMQTIRRWANAPPDSK